MAGPSAGTSAALSAALFLAVFLGLQVFKPLLTSNEKFIVLGGAISSLLFFFALTVRAARASDAVAASASLLY